MEHGKIASKPLLNKFFSLSTSSTLGGTRNNPCTLPEEAADNRKFVVFSTTACYQVLGSILLIVGMPLLVASRLMTAYSGYPNTAQVSSSERVSNTLLHKKWFKNRRIRH